MDNTEEKILTEEQPDKLYQKPKKKSKSKEFSPLKPFILGIAAAIVLGTSVFLLFFVSS